MNLNITLHFLKPPIILIKKYMKLALGIEYNGKNYHGWQIQKEVKSVQETLEKAISNIADSKIKITCAGRTDTGVHSSGQTIHFETNIIRSKKAWTIGVNSKLPKDIAVRWIKEVPKNFHARFSALSRCYQYIIYNDLLPSPLIQDYTFYFYKQLDEKKMNIASKLLLGEHDFTSFRSSTCQSKSPYRKIISFKTFRIKTLVIIQIEANSFLHHMIRNIISCLLEIGIGKKQTFWILEILKKKNRSLFGAMVPASGLNLIRVKYPKFFKIVYKSSPSKIFLI